MADEGEPGQAPAGWYADPQGGGGRRYWDGTRWTEQTQPAQPPAGWYEDPQGGVGTRYWDGTRWTERTQPAQPSPGAVEHPDPAAAGGGPSQPTSKPRGGMAALKGFYREHRVWSWVIIVFVGLSLLTAIGALIPAEEDGDGGGSGQQAAEEQPAEKERGGGSEEQTSEEQPSEEQTSEEPTESPQDRVTQALADAEGPVEDPEVTDVQFGKKEVEVTAKTPEGGLEGPSTADLDRLTGAIFAAIYGDAGWNKTGAVAVYKGGLVDSKTGQELPDANTGIYTISRADASKIDWADQDTIDFGIDWSLYRDFAHPALKQD